MHLREAQAVVDRAVAARVAPAAAIEVGRAGGAVWEYATGRLTYDTDAAPVTLATIFDLASLTKVLSTATLALEQVSSGRLPLERPVADLIPCWRAAERANVTVRELLEHSSGLPAHRPYSNALAGREAYQHAICQEPLEYAPRTRSIYSDLGFILLGFILEDTGSAGLDIQFDAWKRAARIDHPIRFQPPREWASTTAPTEEEPWRGRVICCEVHDENAAALNGVAGHAGLFGTAAAVGACARWWLRLLQGNDDPATSITAAQAARFAERSRVPGSSRGLGWDTMLPTSSSGTRLSNRAVGHTGFTGTSLWIDPEQDLYAVLLTNRVHPSREGDAIQAVRRAFHDAVIDDLSKT